MFGTDPSELRSRIEWWKRVIARQQVAGVTLAKFCRQTGITPRKFYYWRKRLREAEGTIAGPQASGRESLGPRAAPARGITPSFVPVSIVNAGAATELEIELANGCTIRLKGSVDPRLLDAAITATGQIAGLGRGDR